MWGVAHSPSCLQKKTSPVLLLLMTSMIASMSCRGKFSPWVIKIIVRGTKPWEQKESAVGPSNEKEQMHPGVGAGVKREPVSSEASRSSLISAPQSWRGQADHQSPEDSNHSAISSWERPTHPLFLLFSRGLLGLKHTLTSVWSSQSIYTIS